MKTQRENQVIVAALRVHAFKGPGSFAECCLLTELRRGEAREGQRAFGSEGETAVKQEQSKILCSEVDEKSSLS